MLGKVEGDLFDDVANAETAPKMGGRCESVFIVDSQKMQVHIEE
jgi:hypothetical protein